MNGVESLHDIQTYTSQQQSEHIVIDKETKDQNQKAKTY